MPVRSLLVAPLLAALLLLGALALLARSGAPSWAAPGPEAEAAAPTWLFDVRVVRVRVAHRTAEQGPAWPGGEADEPFTTAAWPAALELLSRRGTTTLALARSGAGLAGRTLTLAQTRTTWALSLRRTDGQNFTRESVPVTEIAEVALQVVSSGGGAPVLEYEARVQWAQGGDGAHDVGPVLHEGRWKGSADAPAGRTLVLRHAHQADDPQQPATEVYVLITARRAVRGG